MMCIETTLSIDDYERIYKETKEKQRQLNRLGAQPFNEIYNRLVREAIARKKVTR